MGEGIKPEKAELESLDIVADNKSKLKQLFPSVFTETKGEKGKLIESIDFEKLKAELGKFSDVFESRKERYGLDWAGKKDCMKLIQQPSRATLKPCRDESVDFDNTENLFIEGDNLEVLKLLQKSYYGKIKMIYIDPPYNTGNDFVYPDDYADNLQNYLELTGQVDSDGRKKIANTDTTGRYHSNWLNMIYPRLYLARNLLKEDGVIFISIDDNEVSNLKKVCDQVFGEEHFVGTLIWKRRASSAMADDNLSADHDFVLCYKRGKFAGLLGYEKNFSAYKNPDNDPRGPWVLGDLTVGMTAAMRPNQAYDLVDPKTGITFPFNPNRVWAYIPESMTKMVEEGRVIFPDDPERRPMQKRFKNELKSTHNPFSTLMLDKVGLNTEATRVIQDLFGRNLFEYSKPPTLLKTLIPQVCKNQGDIILDFFSGSSVSAHAVLDLNKKDGGNRKFIMVQLPEPCDEKSEAFKAGYKTIADIGKERIRRVIEKIKEEREEEAKQAAGTLPSMAEKQKELDLGFKVFKLDESNFRVWDGSKVEATEEELAQQLDMHLDNIINNSPEDILYELILKAGFQPTIKIETKNLTNKTVYSVADGAMLICLENEITRELIDAIANEEPMQFICLDKGFKGNDQLKANTIQTFNARNQGREKSQQIIFRTV